MSDFKMTPSPKDASDSLIEKLYDDEMKHVEALAKVFDRIESVMHKPPVPEVTELLFHTNRRRSYEFERCPVGHDLGWRCFDPNQLAGEHLVIGYGKTEDEAYVDLLHQIDDEKPKPRPGRLVNLGNPESPPEVVDVTFDADLEDQ